MKEFMKDELKAPSDISKMLKTKLTHWYSVSCQKTTNLQGKELGV